MPHATRKRATPHEPTTTAFNVGGVGRVGRAILDDLVCPPQHRRRNCEAERLGCLQIDDQLELGRLLDGEIGGLITAKTLERAIARDTRSTAISQ